MGVPPITEQAEPLQQRNHRLVFEDGSRVRKQHCGGVVEVFGIEIADCLQRFAVRPEKTEQVQGTKLSFMSGGSATNDCAATRDAAGSRDISAWKLCAMALRYGAGRSMRGLRNALSPAA